MRLQKPTIAQLKLWASLEQAKIRRQENLFLAEGSKVVAELLKSPWKTETLLILEDKGDHHQGVLAALSGKVNFFGLTAMQWRGVSQDKHSEGLIAVASVPSRPAVADLISPGHARLLLLHEINNPNNLGALLRAADWFGFKTVLLSRGSVDFTHPKVVRTAMGSLFHLKVMADLDFLQILPALRESHRLIGSDARSGVPPSACVNPTALLLGSESHGLPDHLSEMADEIWRIPGAGEAESLSLPQAAAILMYVCTSPS